MIDKRGEEIRKMNKALEAYFIKFNIDIPFGFLAITTKHHKVENIKPKDLIVRFPFLLENIIFDYLEEFSSYDDLKLIYNLAQIQHSSSFIRKFLTKLFQRLAVFRYDSVVNKHDIYKNSTLNHIFYYDIKKNKFNYYEFDTAQNTDVLRYFPMNEEPDVLIESNSEFMDWTRYSKTTFESDKIEFNTD